MTEALYVGTRKGLLIWTRESGSWKRRDLHFLGDPVTMLLPDPHTPQLFAALTLGHFGSKLRRLRDGGPWEECAVPEYPAGETIAAGPPSGDEPVETKPATLQEIWSLESAATAQGPLLWAGTIPGGLFCSRDHGDTWELNRPLWNKPERKKWFGGGKDDPGVHSICVHPHDSKRLTVAVSCGGVWQSENSGEEWTLVGKGIIARYMPPDLQEDLVTQDPHRLVQNRTDPGVMWIQHHNGIFHSTNGGLEWREMTHAAPSPFGFAVATHPHDPQTAWFVPAVKDEVRVPVDGKFVVTRTTDGGRSFTAHGAGLPAEDAFELVYRHGLDVASDGRTLAMGTTTGGLWISEDGGETWDCLSTHLAPIYCVRFGRDLDTSRAT